MLPGRSGLDVLAALQDAKPGLPVIVLTALGEVEHRVAGLDAGAVDYLTKPFSLTELAARIRAQLRAAAHSPRTTLSAGDIEVNLITREVRRGGELVRLSTTEFELLAYLMHNRGHVLSQGADPARGLGLRIRPRHERRRRLHRIPPPEASPTGHESRRSSLSARSATGSKRARRARSGTILSLCARDCIRCFRPDFGGG